MPLARLTPPHSLYVRVTVWETVTLLGASPRGFLDELVKMNQEIRMHKKSQSHDVNISAKRPGMGYTSYMNSLQINPRGQFLYLGTVILFVISFWSSGVLLIRTLDSYDAWSSVTGITLLFILSIPLVYVSILGVQKIFHASKDRGDSVVYDTLTGVLIVHAVALIFFPDLYSFDANTALSAVAWLLWFGGWTLIIAKRVKGLHQ